jgi:hypothetical protein
MTVKGELEVFYQDVESDLEGKRIENYLNSF